MDRIDRIKKLNFYATGSGYNPDQSAMTHSIISKPWFFASFVKQHHLVKLLPGKHVFEDTEAPDRHPAHIPERY